MEKIWGILPYFLLYLYVVLTNSNSSKRVKLLSDPRIVMFIVLIFAALRGNGNGDYFKYYENVSLVTSWHEVVAPISYPFEIGFRLLAFITNLLNFDPQFAIASMNVISIGSIYYVINKYSRDANLSILLFIPFLLQYDMHHSRSAVAMSLTLLMFTKIFEGKYILALISGIISISFHKASILPITIVLIWTVIRKRNFTFKAIRYRSIFVSILFVYVLVQFVNPYNVVLGVLDVLGFSGMHYKLSSYLANERWSYSFSLLDPRFVLLVFTYFGGYLAQCRAGRNDKFFILLNDMLLIGIVSIILLSNSTIVTMRIYNYFNLFSIIQIPSALYYLQKSNLSFTTILSSNRSINVSKLYNKNTLMLVYIIYTLALIFKQVPYYFVFT